MYVLTFKPLSIVFFFWATLPLLASNGPPYRVPGSIVLDEVDDEDF